MIANARLKTVLRHLIRSDDAIIKYPTPSVCSASLTTIQDKEFQYTLNSLRLSREQRQFYEDNGFIVIKNLIGDRILDLCRDHFVDICNGIKSPDNQMFLMKEPFLHKAGAKGENLYYKIQDILFDDVFSQYTTLPELLDYVQCFTGPNITAIHSMLLNKPPAAAETTIHPLHQDLLYFPVRPADLIVGVWTAMETVDTDNGCLVVVPGSHKSGQLYDHGTLPSQKGPYKTFYGVKGLQQTATIPLRMSKGDTVFLHPLLLHGSGPNRSKRYRKAISCHYAASECNVIDTRGTAHEEAARRFESVALKRAGVPYDFGTLLKVRSTVVRGSVGFTADLS